MVKLKEVIASVLRDVLEAQHEANLLTGALSEEYGDDGLPKHLLVPAVTIGEIEITLNYAIARDEESSDDAGKDPESLDVIVDGKKLGELTQDAIQTISFKVNPQSLNRAKAHKQ